MIYVIPQWRDKAGGADKDSPGFRLVLAIMIPFFILLGLIQVSSSVIVDIVTEKESKMKVVQAINGLSDFVYWLAWLGYFTFLSLICIAVIFGVLVHLRLFHHSNLAFPFLIMLF